MSGSLAITHAAEAVAQCCSECSRDAARSKMRAVLSGRSFTLNLQKQGVITLPASLASLQSLQVLNLSWNRLRELPWAASSLLSLVELYLDHNQLSDLPPAMAELQSLSELHLSHNRLSVLPEVVCELPVLKWLFLKGNPLERLQPSLALMDQLSTLNVDDCPLIFPPADTVAQGLGAIRAFLSTELNRVVPSVGVHQLSTGLVRQLHSLTPPVEEAPRRIGAGISTTSRITCVLGLGGCDLVDLGVGDCRLSAASDRSEILSSSTSVFSAAEWGTGEAGGEGNTEERGAAGVEEDGESSSSGPSHAGAVQRVEGEASEGTCHAQPRSSKEALRQSRLDDIYRERAGVEGVADVALRTKAVPRVATQSSELGQPADERACVVCFEPRTHILVPCGHYCLCGTCSIAILRRTMQCPICRSPFELAMKVF